MKKIISIVLAIAVLATFGITAFAETVTTVTEVPGTDKNDVKVVINSDSLVNVDTVYSVDVKWDSLDFTYSFSDDETNVWDPSDHTYGETNYTGANWDKTSADIVVTNHSNEGVSVAAAIDTATKNGVTATLSNAEFALDTGVGLTYETADFETIGVSIEGVPTIEDGFTIGTITVTISAE